jgi:hypothetical protein
MHKIIPLAILVLLGACAREIRPEAVTGPNGRPGYVMSCGSRVAACYRKAGEVCPGGYDVVGSQTGTVMVPTAHGVLGAPQTTVVVECR